MLVRDAHFMEKMKRSRVEAAVILDDSPRHRWRVSSPYQSLSLSYSLIQNTVFSAIFSRPLHNLDIFLVRRDDWIKYDHVLSQEGHKLFISWNAIR